MTPNDELLHGDTAAFVADLRTCATAPAPEPSAELRALFAATAVVTESPATTTSPRRTPVSDTKRLLTTIPSKIAAGVLGALLAGSLGAGAMTGTISLTSSETDVPETTEVLADDEAVVEDEVVDTDDALVEDEAADEDELEVEEVEAEEETDEPKDAGDPTTAPVPTSVSEAAKNHQFDEACGNHGAYVSHFARTGEEPECALTARSGGEAAPTATEVVATEDGAADATKAEATGPGKSDAGKAKAAAAKAKAAERKAAGGGKGKAGR